MWRLDDSYSHGSVGVRLLEAQQSLYITVIQRQFKTKIHQRYSPLPPTVLHSHMLLTDRRRSAFIKLGVFDTLTVLCWPATSCVPANYITFSYRILRCAVPWREVGWAPRLYSIHFIRCLICINICCAAPRLQLQQRGHSYIFWVTVTSVIFWSHVSNTVCDVIL